MPSAIWTIPKRHALVMVLPFAMALLAAASETLFAGEPLPLPAPTENLEFPAFPAVPEKSEASIAIATDKPLAPDSQVESPQSPRCFVVAPMSTLTIDVSLPSGLLPTHVATDWVAATVDDPRRQGEWTGTDQHWSATGQRHRPLYFEEVNAERYGYTSAYCLQPLISAGHFFLTIPTLPYRLAVDCPHDCASTLGHYRPGSCSPWRLNHLPCRAGAALVQTGTIAALILLIP